MTQKHLHESSCFLIHWNALHTLRSMMKHTWLYHEKTRLQSQPILACLTVSYYITIKNRKTDYYIPKYVVPPNIWLFITEALNSFRPKQTWGTVWMTNLPSAETSSSVLKFSEQGFITVPDATGSTDERGQRPALDNRSLSAINFATYSGPRHRDYSFGPNPKVAHWLMGNQYGRGEFSEALWEERRLVRWWCQRLGEKHSSAEKWRCDKSVTEWEVWKSSKHLFTHQCVNESMKKRVTRRKENQYLNC